MRKIKYIKRLIGEGRISEALDQMIPLFSEDDLLTQDLWFLKSQVTTARRNYLLGLIDSNLPNDEANKITHYLLEAIDNKRLRTRTQTTRIFIQGVVLIAFFLLAITLYGLKSFNNQIQELKRDKEITHSIINNDIAKEKEVFASDTVRCSILDRLKSEGDSLHNKVMKYYDNWKIEKAEKYSREFRLLPQKYPELFEDRKPPALRNNVEQDTSKNLKDGTLIRKGGGGGCSGHVNYYLHTD